MAVVGDILGTKGSQVYTVPETATVLEAIHYMNEHRIGAVVVAHDGRMAGMFTERDVLRRIAAVEEHRRLSDILLAEVMTRDVIYCSPTTTVEDASRIMKEKRVRHLPVCDEQDQLVGLVSMGDLNAFHVHEQATHINHLHDYLYGPN